MKVKGSLNMNLAVIEPNMNIHRNDVVNPERDCERQATRRKSFS